MFVIPELQLKKFVDVNIPSASELFERYGGSIAKSGTSEPSDFSNPVNVAERLDKCSQVARGVEKLREVQKED